jgi:hypothetical protein
VLAGRQAGGRLGGVLLARRAEHDRLDRRIAQRRLQAGAVPGVAVLGGEGRRPLRHPADQPVQVMPFAGQDSGVAAGDLPVPHHGDV